MKYAKLIDNRLQYAPKKIRRGDSITFNPPAEMLLEEGYLPVRETEQPEVEEGYYLSPVYTQEADEIVVTWEQIEDPGYYNATPEEIAEALEGIL